MTRIVLSCILIAGFLVRIVWLDRFPVGFTPDEASFGYDAFSILKTGKDQWGHTFPLVLESFGDFKAPLYSYILIPFVALFGLSRPIVRLPNALLGTAAVYVTYLLVNEILRFASLTQNDKKDKPQFTVSDVELDENHLGYSVETIEIFRKKYLSDRN